MGSIFYLDVLGGCREVTLIVDQDRQDAKAIISWASFSNSPRAKPINVQPFIMRRDLSEGLIVLAGPGHRF